MTGRLTGKNGLVTDTVGSHPMLQDKDSEENMDTGLRGKTAVLSGAARTSGLGHAFSIGLAREGVNIVIADKGDASDAVANIQAIGTRAVAIKCDVSQADDVAQLDRLVTDDFGGCDILIHCASPLTGKSFDDLEFDEWREMLAVNLDGLYLLTRAFLPGMKRRRWGRIIPVSSATYQAGLQKRAHYVTAKAGVLGFTRSLAREVGDFGVTVNALSPGLIRTDGAVQGSTENKTFGDNDPFRIIREQQCIRQTLVPENLVGPLVFLASEQSAFVTGQVLLADAGWQHVG